MADDDLGQIDWRQCPHVERDPEIMSGAWCFEGTRLPVSALFSNLAAGLSIRSSSSSFRTPDPTKSTLCSTSWHAGWTPPHHPSSPDGRGRAFREAIPQGSPGIRGATEPGAVDGTPVIRPKGTPTVSAPPTAAQGALQWAMFFCGREEAGQGQLMMRNSERILVTVLAMLAGLVVSAGSAEADYEYGRTNDVVDEAKVGMWWDTLDVGGQALIGDSSSYSMRWSGLTGAQQSDVIEHITLETGGFEPTLSADDPVGSATSIAKAVGQQGLTGEFDDDDAWWNSLTCAGKLLAVGLHRISSLSPNEAVEYGELLQSDKSKYCVSYLHSAGTGGRADIQTAAMALRAADVEVPALPLVGVGILALLLTGRGAWLRRRRA